ncbi:UbiH/UbiF/VisC/COQ6 family ubiquinone biosynthesis hydroxylase [Oceaniglobus ichthyenteri]|uniref:UbiH/UbiF/VisC/COQ6 family ubiquinone biosynthesis hydroxylase n=1 Tax=Oceaniglobus ichthyenteri TaxID=2136177 RepID=UPI000D367671|nr:UbiH/UbiF/VisC/COQ6 family ubiquinone biosynthesis hydroxylase [Oceaniglobus ichthyenteri]
MTHDTDIVIVGGGLNGATLALALASVGFTITLVDAKPRDVRGAQGFDGRSYAMAHSSCAMMAALGLWAGLAETAQPILDIKVSDGRAGEGASPFVLEFDHAELEEGPMGHMVEDRHLRPHLLAQMDKTPAITQMSGRSVLAQSIEGQSAHVTLDDGTVIAAQLLIGCDGLGSGTAKRAGIRHTGWDYGQTGMVAAIAHEKPHNGIAHQLFMPEGPLAILPLVGNRCSIVWTERTGNAARINALSDAEYLDILRPRFGDFLGDIALAGARYSYPLSLSLANSMVAPRLALCGDAAHRLHPIAGQGLNAGLKDIATLAQVLAEARRRGEDIGRLDVLERYAQWRRFDVATLALATDTFNRLFSNDNPLLRLARDVGLGVVNAMPGLRRGFMREAAGLNGDRPELLQGRAL